MLHVAVATALNVPNQLLVYVDANKIETEGGWTQSGNAYISSVTPMSPVPCHSLTAFSYHDSRR